LRQRAAYFKQAHAEQCEFNFACAFTFMNHPQFPLFELFGVSECHGPQRRQKQQAAPIDFLPQARQAIAKQAAGLLRSVLANQLNLAKSLRDFFPRQRGQAFKQFLCAGQPQAVDRYLQALGRLAQTAVRVVIGVADQAQ
jgi:hypothetical protein